MKTNEPSEEDLKKIVQTPMEVGRYPENGQEAERCVREVTAAPEAVSGHDRRRLAHREKTGSAVKSKKDHAMICT